MTDPREPVQVHVDFNDMDAEGRFFVLPEDATGELALDSEISLFDAEGNCARGIVVDLTESGAMVATIAGSWRPCAVASAIAADEVRQLADVILASVEKARQHLTAWYSVSATPLGALGIAATPSASVFSMAATASAHPRPKGAVASTL